MKGVLELVVEVDYDKILDEKNLQGIYAFTGKKTVREMIQRHMDDISGLLQEVIKDFPFVKYGMRARLVNDAQVEEHQQSKQENESEEGDKENEPEVSNQENESLNESTQEKQDESTIEEELNDAINHVATELGIPQTIKLNDTAFNALNEKMKTLSGNNDGTIATYQGFPVEREGMDTPIVIVYKEYSTNEIKQYAVTK